MSYASVLDKAVAAERERCATVALEQRCERGTPWDLACVAIAEAIRRVPADESYDGSKDREDPREVGYTIEHCSGQANNCEQDEGA